jgi:hypothetical protein
MRAWDWGMGDGDYASVAEFVRIPNFHKFGYVSARPNVLVDVELSAHVSGNYGYAIWSKSE